MAANQLWLWCLKCIAASYPDSEVYAAAEAASRYLEWLDSLPLAKEVKA